MEVLPDSFDFPHVILITTIHQTSSVLLRDTLHSRPHHNFFSFLLTNTLLPHTSPSHHHTSLPHTITSLPRSHHHIPLSHHHIPLTPSHPSLTPHIPPSHHHIPPSCHHIPPTHHASPTHFLFSFRLSVSLLSSSLHSSHMFSIPVISHSASVILP